MGRTITWEHPAIFDPIYQPTFDKRFLILSGGRSSAKSWSIAKKILLDCMQEKEDVLIIRKNVNKTDQSSKKLLEILIRKYNLPYVIMDKKIICTRTKSEIVFFGLSSTTVDGIRSAESFKKVWLEEAQNIEISHFEILEPTIRMEDSQIYLSYNPKFKNDIANHIMKLFPDDFLYIHSTYLNNPFASKRTIKSASQYKLNKPNEYRYIWLGEYKDLTEDLLCPDYSEFNIMNVNYVPSLPLHVTCDFNWNPNCFLISHMDSDKECKKWDKKEGKVYFIDEYCHTQSTRKQIKQILNDYPHNGLVIINGDASGFQKRSGQDDGCDYDQIEFELKEAGYRKDSIQNRKHGYKKLYRIDVPLANGSRYSRYQAWNDMILDPITGKRRILISPKCEKLIYNMENLKLKPGSPDFFIPTATQIGSDDADMLKFLGHPFDGASYLPNYYFPVSSGKEQEHVTTPYSNKERFDI